MNWTFGLLISLPAKLEAALARKKADLGQDLTPASMTFLNTLIGFLVRVKDYMVLDLPTTAGSSGQGREMHIWKAFEAAFIAH